jgi:amidase
MRPFLRVTVPTMMAGLLGVLATATGVFCQAHFEVTEASIPQLQAALESGQVTSRGLVELYLARIAAYDQDGPRLNAIRHLNEQALQVADQRDQDRQNGIRGGPLFGIPILIKDNINTQDQPTTAGLVALEGSIPPDDAFIVKQLKDAGAIILGKANLGEFANFLTTGMPDGYSSLGNFVFNPYDPRPDPGQPDGRPILSPGGSSAGSAVAAAASFAAAAIGTETSGSILWPSNQNSLVGIKPTVGLASRTGIIPIASSQDTAGPLARTVTDAAILLGALTAADPADPATQAADRTVYSDYTQFLDANALRGARIGIAFGKGGFVFDGLSPPQPAIMNAATKLMTDLGADVFRVEITTSQALLDSYSRSLTSVLEYEFKRDLNAYLGTLPAGARVHSLADVIAFNNAFWNQYRFRFGQAIARAAAAIDLDAARPEYLAARANDLQVSRDEIDRVMAANNLDALLFSTVSGADIGARAGYPSVIVPAAFLSRTGAPYGITFLGRAWSEPRLLALAYAFEQASHARQPPPSTPPLP